jgi:hypothetical protein
MKTPILLNGHDTQVRNLHIFREYFGCEYIGLYSNAFSTEIHPVHPRVTVACQLDWALFALGLNLAKSTSLAA